MGKVDNFTGIFFSDLDGTLAEVGKKVSEKDVASLKKLGELGVARVIVTGRSLFSAEKVIDKDFPIDYLICSTGALIVSWPDKKILKKHNLTASEMERSAELFRSYNIDFMVLHETPENHKFDTFIFDEPHPDVLRRHSFYEGYYKVRPYEEKLSRKSCQLIGIIDENEVVFEEIIEKSKDLKVIRSTSPLDKKSMWIEIYPGGVSKGKSVHHMLEYLNIKKEMTAAVGNDFNDTDMLEEAGMSFVVANSPEKMKSKFKNVSSCEESGFSEAVEEFISEVFTNLNNSKICRKPIPARNE
jgi:hypothetical protein